MPAPVLLLDTHSLLFRAFHALPLMCTSTGVRTGALDGLSARLRELLREQAPARLAYRAHGARAGRPCSGPALTPAKPSWEPGRPTRRF